MIKLLAERETHSEVADALAITVSMRGSKDDLMEELEHLLHHFYEAVYKQNGKRVLSNVIMITRDAIQDITDEAFGGKHGKL